MDCRFVAATASLSLALVAGAQSTVNVALVYKEGDSVGGSTISTLNTPFTDGTGRMASLVILADTRRVILDENLAIIFDSATVTGVTVSGGEGTMGFSDANGYIYSPTINGEDGVYSNGGSLLRGTDAAPGLPGLFNTFNSRRTMTSAGTAFWIAGTSTTSGGATTTRVVYQNATPTNPAATTLVMQGGETYGGLVTTAQGIAFDYDFSDDGLHRIHSLTATGPAATDIYIAADNVLVAREGSAAPVGNYSGTLRNVGINNAGTFVFTADTTAATTMDEIVVSNAGMVLQEGTVVGGTTLSGTVNATSINNNGEVVLTWGTGATEVLIKGPVATLSTNAVKLLQVNDLADTNGDGTGDYTVIDFEASSVIGPGLDLADDGRVFVEVTLRPIGGTSADDVGAIIRLPGDEPGCDADLDDDGDFANGGNPDGGVDINDLLFFLAGFEQGDIAVDLDDDGDPASGNPDGGVDINDLLFFLARFEVGC